MQQTVTVWWGMVAYGAGGLGRESMAKPESIVFGVRDGQWEGQER